MPKSAERLAWLSGFTGSAGLVIVLADKAAIFIDGRYTVQVRDQVDTSVFTPIDIGTISPSDWLETELGSGKRLGYDPWLHTPAQVERYRNAALIAGAQLASVDENPIDAIWDNRPPEPLGMLSLHPLGLSGEDTKTKIARVNAALGANDAMVISDPHAVCWLFNIRGSDVAHTPIPLAYAVLPKDGTPHLYIDLRKVSGEVRDALDGLVEIEDYGRLRRFLQTLGLSRHRILFDAATVPEKLTEVVREAGGVVELAPCPISLMKARKNTVELNGARAAHLRDGVAVTRFLCWFDANAPKGDLTEIDAVKALETFRRETGALKDVSFPTISAAGPNAALPHYRVTENSNRTITPGMFLVDSGAQYRDGTTDITRTVSVGTPNAEMRDRFTRVLKGNIAISRAVFPVGTTGAQIDALARAPLWQAGLDFEHGTGHGIGSYLSVHEGPQRISKMGGVALDAGMILSNEPGFYAEGKWGIRIENLIIVELRNIAGGERDMLGFETITLAPIDPKLIDVKLLDAGEIEWLNAYHARVRDELMPYLDDSEQKWLKSATKKLGKK